VTSQQTAQTVPTLFKWGEGKNQGFGKASLTLWGETEILHFGEPQPAEQQLQVHDSMIDPETFLSLFCMSPGGRKEENRGR